MPRQSIIAVTMGDPGGIGPEIILKALKSCKKKQSQPILVVGSRAVFEFAGRKCRVSIPFHFISELDQFRLRSDSINFLDISRETEKSFAPGKVTRANAKLAFKSLETAARLAKEKKVQGIVTAPVHKEAMRLADPHFVGHTEYLAKVSRTKEFAMLFHSQYFCVTLVTIHVPLRKVADTITAQSIRSKIRLTHDFLRKKLKIKSPQIAVACLNPHGSEFGPEEDQTIIPAIKFAQKQGIKVSGPLPGDQVFHDAYQKKYHAVVSMYHDQGLAPFKMIAFDTGVNVTVGLPFIRTSPDHGTAFDIAYRNKANPTSFSQALQFALQLA